VPRREQAPENTDKPDLPDHPCPKCGGPMVIIETFEPGCIPKNHRQRGPPDGTKDIS
jgi:hypothetical protein